MISVSWIGHHQALLRATQTCLLYSPGRIIAATHVPIYGREQR